MKKIILVLIVVFSFIGCAGPMWEGESRSLEDDTMNITIVFDDPLWVYMLHSSGNHSLCEEKLPGCTEY